ncbi:facilitated trehalose transporter Tret1-like [Diorhabda sublineata]|uniref:facilitated trehalose transporter Tret1-like n=1 Tax=Diorhabda sublineata TaxID=1163346 RepID=UPI0024E10954|nr:facilitated trehalose transporter Tret1-like [Diorhabda sublineata]
MDQIGASHISLRPIHDEEEEEEIDNLENLIVSSKSLSAYEQDSFKCLLPQIIASIIAASFAIGNGVSMSYSAILISQLEAPDSGFHVSKTQNAFMASIVPLMGPLASILSGFLMDKFGRVNALRLAIIPGIFGWSSLALAPNFQVIMVGRILTGIASTCASNPILVYITEIAHPKMRMSFMQMIPSYVSLGMIITYFGGSYVNWRTIAWLTNGFLIVSLIASSVIRESPLWLIYKGKLKEAKKSLTWFHKYQPNPLGKKETYAELEFKALKKKQDEKDVLRKEKKSVKDIIREFRKPTGYRPVLIMIPLFFFQQFSGIYVTMFYAITFIQDSGSNINAYFASSFIGLIRLVMAIFNVFILRYINRRTAIMVSGVGMAIFIFISGLYTQWNEEGVTTASWIPVAAILMYVVCSVTGLMFLPSMVTPELFPIEIRGVGYTIGYSITMLLMFGSLQSYYYLKEVLGGPSHLQWFYAIMCLAACVYTFIFLPETRGKKLSEISEYFNEGWTYIGRSHKKDKNLRKTKTIVG